MPQISKKGNELPQSAIRKLVPFSDEAKSRGIHVYHLNIGQPDIETPKGALKTLAETKIGVLAYSHSAGNLSYRKKLCEYYAKHDIHVTPDQIIVTTGGSEALQFAFTVCLNPGDEIIIPNPTTPTTTPSPSCATPPSRPSRATSTAVSLCLPSRPSRKPSPRAPAPS